jgi:four helix bundle protein
LESQDVGEALGTVLARTRREGATTPAVALEGGSVMSFYALEYALVTLDRLAPVETKLRRRRKSLADQVARAADSVALNLAEGAARAGADRIDLWRRANGSARELTTALRIALARGLITAAEHAAIDEPLDHVRAILWRLARP